MLASAQQTGAQSKSGASQEKKEETSQEKQSGQEKKPAPLFQGTLGVRSSERTKTSATLGFNGIDPSGKLEASVMAASPSAADVEKAEQMAAHQPSAEELKAFREEGGLKAR